MDATVQSDTSKPIPRFLSNMNKEDTLQHSEMLLGEILGSKLHNLKAIASVKDYSTKTKQNCTSNLKSDKNSEALSILVKPKLHSPKQSELSGFVTENNGSVGKRIGSVEKDRTGMATTKSGFRSEHNSVILDLRLKQVPQAFQINEVVSQKNSDQNDIDRDNITEMNDDMMKEGLMDLPAEKIEFPVKEFKRSLTERQPANSPRKGKANQIGSRCPQLEHSKKGILKGKIGLSSSNRASIHPIPTKNEPKVVIRENESSNSLQKLLHKSEASVQDGQTSIVIVNEPKITKLDIAKSLEHRRKMDRDIEDSSHMISSEARVLPTSTVLSARLEKDIQGCSKSKILDQKKNSRKLEIDVYQPKTEATDRELKKTNEVLTNSPSKKGILVNKDRINQKFETTSMYELASLPRKNISPQNRRSGDEKVKFSDNPTVYEVQSYKSYYKTQFSDPNCCNCTLI